MVNRLYKEIILYKVQERKTRANTIQNIITDHWFIRHVELKIILYFSLDISYLSKQCPVKKPTTQNEEGHVVLLKKFAQQLNWVHLFVAIFPFSHPTVLPFIFPYKCIISSLNMCVIFKPLTVIEDWHQKQVQNSSP